MIYFLAVIGALSLVATAIVIVILVLSFFISAREFKK